MMEGEVHPSRGLCRGKAAHVKSAVQSVGDVSHDILEAGERPDHEAVGILSAI